MKLLEVHLSLLSLLKSLDFSPDKLKVLFDCRLSIWSQDLPKSALTLLAKYFTNRDFATLCGLLLVAISSWPYATIEWNHL